MQTPKHKEFEVEVEVTRTFIMVVNAPNKHTAMSAVEDLCEESSRHVDDEIETILHDDAGDWVSNDKGETQQVTCEIEDSIESFSVSSWASELTGGKPLAAWEK